MPAATVCAVERNFVHNTRAGASRLSCVDCFLHPVGVTLAQEDARSPSSPDHYEVRGAGCVEGSTAEGTKQVCMR
jgi:hypothetical protein